MTGVWSTSGGSTERNNSLENESSIYIVIGFSHQACNLGLAGSHVRQYKPELASGPQSKATARNSSAALGDLEAKVHGSSLMVDYLDDLLSVLIIETQHRISVPGQGRHI